MTVTTVANWPLVWTALGLFAVTFAALYGLACLVFPDRPKQDPRSDSEQQ